MVLILIILLIVIAVLLTYIIVYKRDIGYIGRQIQDSKGDFYSIRMGSTSKDLEKLVLRINELYNIHQHAYIQIRIGEEELRHSIENMSHDLRTPLTSIMGYIQLIKDDTLSWDERNRYIEIVERRTKSLQSLIASFYDLSRIESREYNFHLQPVQLDRILMDTLALFYQDFTNKNLEPIIQIDEKIPTLISDENAVIRIFTNVLNNILKHGGSPVYISVSNNGNNIVTEFRNQAQNLKEEHVGRLFERFFTADSTRSNQNTGIGLSITKALTEQLGHHIEASLKGDMLSICITWNIKRT